MLKGADISKLPVLYKARKKSSMTGNIFCSLMKKFETRMHIAWGKVIMFMHNASVLTCAASLKLKAVKVVYSLAIH